ncbi:MAG: DUF3710 domain-containing protein [Mycobacteriales bacterium]|nr:DUF3710 domain-containing protein [Frankia sp.]
MAIFRRKKSDDDETATDSTTTPAASAGDVAAAPPPAPTTGPYDESDVDDDEERPRLDLGGIRVPVPDGLEVRVEVDQQGQVAAAVVVDRGNQLQLNAFAAPRHSGIWDEVRAELRAALTPAGAPEEVDGPFGRELRARIPGDRPGVTTPARFVGADGPRWFLRGLITGPAATDAAQAGRLHGVFRETVVVRGKEAMAPRDPLPLHLPREVSAAVESGELSASGPGSGDDFNPFERGPEITEVR